MTFESVSWPKEFQTEVIIGRRVVAEASNAWLLFGTGIAGSPRAQALCCLVHEARGLSIQTSARAGLFLFQRPDSAF